MNEINTTKYIYIIIFIIGEARAYYTYIIIKAAIVLKLIATNTNVMHGFAF